MRVKRSGQGTMDSRRRRIACLALFLPLLLASATAPGFETIAAYDLASASKRPGLGVDLETDCALIKADDPRMERRRQLAKKKGYRRSEHVYQLPERALVSMDGKATSLARELDTDRPVMLNFIFTTCTTICPILSATFSQVQKKLGPESEQITMISISIDPEYDTPEQLQVYAERFGAGPQWRFLTGEMIDIIAVEKAFDAYRGSKMSHEPLTFLRAGSDSKWVRLDGIASAEEIVNEYRQLVSR